MDPKVDISYGNVFLFSSDFRTHSNNIIHYTIIFNQSDEKK